MGVQALRPRTYGEVFGILTHLGGTYKRTIW